MTVSRSAFRPQNSALESVIAKGSKSFALAARLFDGPTCDGAVALYAWCRRCDDEIDGSELGFRAGDRPAMIAPEEALRRLGILRARTEAALDGHPDADPAFAAFSAVVRTFQIPRAYPRELLEGMAMDVSRERYESFDGLLHYCYRVAGTVGLMMSHVMGLADAAALRNAAELGMAMQLTNIARDVREDHEAGRVYLPLAWLRAAGVPADDFMNPAHRDGLVSVVGRLLNEAERLYRSGDAGLRALPFRSACAVAAARRVYAEIGRVVRRRGGAAWDARAIVNGPRKAALAAAAVGDVLGTLPARRARPWRRAPLERVWNPFSTEVIA